MLAQLDPTRFLFEFLLLVVFLYLWFRPGPRPRRNRFRRRVRRWRRRIPWRKVAYALVLVFVVIPYGVGMFVPTLRYFPSFLEAQKLRLTYGVVSLFFESIGWTDTVPDATRSQALRYGVEVPLVRAVLQAESSGHRLAVSSTGAMGLMQLMPSTYYSFGSGNPFSVEHNIASGTRYLRRLLDRFGGNYRLAVAAYHAGPSAVSRCRCVPPNGQTPLYVGRVANLYRQYGGRKSF